jgi:putative transposase
MAGVQAAKHEGVISMANSLAYTKWVCKYHIVFTPKFRRKVIYNKYKESVVRILEDLCKWKGVKIIVGKAMIDHTHLLISIPPRLSVPSFMGYLKGKSALMIFERHANLKNNYGNRHFWARGYYVSTVGLNEARIAKYVREQEKQDQIMDRISTKEAEDPFRGS